MVKPSLASLTSPSTPLLPISHLSGKFSQWAKLSQSNFSLILSLAYLFLIISFLSTPVIVLHLHILPFLINHTKPARFPNSVVTSTNCFLDTNQNASSLKEEFLSYKRISYCLLSFNSVNMAEFSGRMKEDRWKERRWTKGSEEGREGETSFVWHLIKNQLLLKYCFLSLLYRMSWKAIY